MGEEPKCIKVDAGREGNSHIHKYIEIQLWRKDLQMRKGSGGSFGGLGFDIKGARNRKRQMLCTAPACF